MPAFHNFATNATSSYAAGWDALLEWMTRFLSGDRNPQNCPSTSSVP